MTAGDSYDAEWRERAACAGADTNRWFAANPAQALKFCALCHVRPECLYEALRHEPPHHRYGVWGGLTPAERKAHTAPVGPRTAAVAALRELLPAPDVSAPAPPERTDPPVNITPTPSASAAPTSDIELVTISKLLRWAAEHPDPAVQKEGASAEDAVAGLRKRYAADQELNSITSEAAKLETRLAELRAREAELEPAKPKPKRKPVGYPAAAVRVWARENGIACPAVGRVPTAVVDAWRSATGGGDA